MLIEVDDVISIAESSLCLMYLTALLLTQTNALFPLGLITAPSPPHIHRLQG